MFFFWGGVLEKIVVRLGIPSLDLCGDCFFTWVRLLKTDCSNTKSPKAFQMGVLWQEDAQLLGVPNVYRAVPEQHESFRTLSQ